MLWLGGALAVRDTVIHQVGGQADLPRTLLGQLGLDGSMFTWSRDLLATGARSWAWFSFKDGFGFVTDSGAVAWDNTGQRLIARSSITADNEVESGQAVLQRLIDDYVKR